VDIPRGAPLIDCRTTGVRRFVPWRTEKLASTASLLLWETTLLQKRRGIMNSDNLKDALKRLHANLESSGNVDSELKKLLQVLDSDIHLLIGKEAQDSAAARGLVERVQFISTKFATRHPHIEPLLREVVDILTGMGI
jgi:Domain of unknown function (DUF4404)